MSVLIETSFGEIVIDLLVDVAPKACQNFLKLCKIKYYNGVLVFNVQRNLLIQTGDPTGTGRGGSSIFGVLYGEQAKYFEDEINPNIKHTKVGLVSMANSGENTNASSFFITTREDIDYLDGKHTIFGEVVEGMDVVMKINDCYLDDSGRPLQDIRIKHTYILDDPYPDPPGFIAPESSPERAKPSEEIVEERIPAEIDWEHEDEGKNPEEIEKEITKKEAKTNAVVLEMIGDIPDAEVKPPENVLFVCKLNPLTQEEDLELIFSRFGKVKSADIIKDYKTGDSLNYGFIEFETEEACNEAFFKMDNVVIDDRRIHVDFSQSVSRLWRDFHKNGAVGSKSFSDNNMPQRRGPQLELKKNALPRGTSGYNMVFEEEPGSRRTDTSRAERRANHRSSPKGRGHRSRERSRDKLRNRSKDRSRNRSKDRSRNRSKDRLRNRSKDGSRDRSKRRDYHRDRPKDQRESRRERLRSRSNS